MNTINKFVVLSIIIGAIKSYGFKKSLLLLIEILIQSVSSAFDEVPPIIEQEPEGIFATYKFFVIQKFVDKWIDTREKMLCGMILGIVLFMVILRFFMTFMVWFLGNQKRAAKLACYRMRGIAVDESIIPGSDFEKTQQPSCQVGILIPGLLTSTHQGYGIRIGDFLVTAKHCLTPFRNQELLLQTDKSTVLWKVDYTTSNFFSDIAYCYLPSTIWSKLHVSKASVYNGTLSYAELATAYGQQGKSSGYVRKNPSTQGQLIYEGSTIAGMSGCGLFIDSRLVGIHQSTNRSLNFSAYAPWINHEINNLQYNEAYDGGSAKLPERMKFNQDRLWETYPDKMFSPEEMKAAHKEIRHLYKDTDWNAMAIDEESGTITYKGKIYAMVRDAPIVNQSTVTMVDEEEPVIKTPEKPAKLIACKECSKQFVTYESMAQHVDDVHIRRVTQKAARKAKKMITEPPMVTKEAVVTDQYKDGSGNDFLEQLLRYQKKNGKTLQQFLNLLASLPQSTSDRSPTLKRTISGNSKQ